MDYVLVERHLLKKEDGVFRPKVNKGEREEGWTDGVGSQLFGMLTL